LFSGIGGFALAAKWAGFTTVAFVEIEPYAQEVIKERFGAVADTDCQRRQQERGSTLGDEKEDGRAGWNGSESNGDNLVAGNGEGRRPRLFRDIRTFDGTKYRGTTLVTGGFPCQPFSQAGLRRGKEDDRYLWHEMLRVVRECQPAWVVAENVDGLTSMVEFDSVLEVDSREYTREEMAAGQASVGEVRERVGRGLLHQIMEDLCAAGYAVQTFVVPACAVDAKHRRDRLWIVGHAEERQHRQHQDGERQSGKGRLEPEPAGEDVAHADSGGQRRQGVREEQPQRAEAVGAGEDVADTGSGRYFNGSGASAKSNGKKNGIFKQDSEHCRWLPEPDVGRVANGVPRRVDRLKGLGNAIVPQVAYEILRVIAKIESDG